MILAGVPVRAGLVGEVAALLAEGHPLRGKLLYELERRSPIVDLTVQERVTLVGVLGDDPPSGLRSLRDTLLSTFRQAETRGRRGYASDEPDAAEIHDA